MALGFMTSAIDSPLGHFSNGTDPTSMSRCTCLNWRPISVTFMWGTRTGIYQRRPSCCSWPWIDCHGWKENITHENSGHLLRIAARLFHRASHEPMQCQSAHYCKLPGYLPPAVELCSSVTQESTHGAGSRRPGGSFCEPFPGPFGKGTRCRSAEPECALS